MHRGATPAFCLLLTAHCLLPSAYCPLPTAYYHSRGSLLLTPESCSFPHLPPINYLFFQQHSRLKLVTTCVFYNIPGYFRGLEIRPFVFIDIPALFRHF
jgi:hypothetical protein